jgi:hypothetical protein
MFEIAGGILLGVVAVSLLGLGVFCGAIYLLYRWSRK